MYDDNKVHVETEDDVKAEMRSRAGFAVHYVRCVHYLVYILSFTPTRPGAATVIRERIYGMTPVNNILFSQQNLSQFPLFPSLSTFSQIFPIFSLK